jgi:hypothetical protein
MKLKLTKVDSSIRHDTQHTGSVASAAQQDRETHVRRAVLPCTTLQVLGAQAVLLASCDTLGAAVCELDPVQKAPEQSWHAFIVPDVLQDT